MATRCCANRCRQQHLNPERSVGFLPTTFSGSIIGEQLRLNRAASTVPPSRGVLAQLVRAPPCHGGGCGFEPRRLRSFSFVYRGTVGHGDLVLPRIKAASTDHRPAPTIRRKRRPSHIEKSVRASCIMLQKPYRDSFISENPQKP